MSRVGKIASARNCKTCGISFTPKFKKRHQRYCSIHCVWIGTKGPEYNAKIARDSVERRATAQRNTGEGKSYRKLMGEHEHRVIAARMLGRPLQRGEVVHHKDGDYRNNSRDNLAVMTQGEHMREHGIAIPGKKNMNHPSLKAKKEKHDGRI